MAFGIRLPVVINKQYKVEYETVSVKLNPSEMTLVATERMSGELEKRLFDSTLLRIRTEGRFTDDAYTLESSIVYLKKVGADLSFEVASE